VSKSMSKSIRNVSAFVACAIVAGVLLNRESSIVAPAPAAEAVVPGIANGTCTSDPPVANEEKAVENSVARPAIGPGDRLKLAFYEILQSTDEKWGADRQRTQEPRNGVQLRAEFSREYLVQEDGTVSIPILGTFAVAGLKPSAPLVQIECAFGAFLGKQGYVNIVSVTKQPIYVVGKVKNSGAFDYTPGMSVLHAVALAGGFDKATMEPWQVVDMARNTEVLQGALERVSKMVARTAAIEAVRSDSPIKIPEELPGLVGDEKAVHLISEELVPRRLAMNALALNEKGLEAAVESATSEVKLRKGIVPVLQKTIELRQERVAGLQKLADTGSIGRPILIQAQSELLDAETRLQETMNSIDVAQDRLSKALRERAAGQTQAAIVQQTDLSTARQEVTKEARDGIAASKVMDAIAATALSSASSETVDYYIIRQSHNESEPILAKETTLLEPGDLLQVRSALSAKRDTASPHDGMPTKTNWSK
jgi:polysaccharide biosynthesis/export protein ExoF